jgi:hypothetical protein
LAKNSTCVPGLLLRQNQGKAQPQHARTVLPPIDQGAAFRPVEREIPQDGEPIWVLANRLDCHLVGGRIPARRMNDGAIYPRFRHLPQQLLGSKHGCLTVAHVRPAARPEMHLRIDDFHDGPPFLFSKKYPSFDSISAKSFLRETGQLLRSYSS